MSEGHAQYPWLFKGAYSIYSGTTNVKPLPGEFEVTTKIEVEDIDLVNKRVKFRTCTSMVQRMWRLRKKVGERGEEGWVKIGEKLLPSATPVILEREYEGVINVQGLGVRRCVVQEWHEIHPRTRIISSAELVFWDKELNWPIQYMAIFQYKIKAPESIWEDALKDALRTAYDLISGSPCVDLEKARNDSRSEVLREGSLILYLKETNIPGLKFNFQGEGYAKKDL
jgi:hypothetical protein